MSDFQTPPVPEPRANFQNVAALTLAIVALQLQADQLAVAAHSTARQARTLAKHLEHASVREAAHTREAVLTTPAPVEVVEPVLSISDDELVPNTIVARDFLHVHPRTLKRWDLSPNVNFAPAVRIRGRIYRRGRNLKQFMLTGDGR
jgi:hypothetical protein